MKSDTSAWMPEGQNCCSRSSPNVRNAPRSRAPPTHRSLNGAPPSPTPAWPQPSSTDSPSTPTSSTPAPTPTDSVPPEQRTETPPSKKAPSPTPPQRDRRGGTPKKTRPWVGPTQTITTGPNGLVILTIVDLSLLDPRAHRLRTVAQLVGHSFHGAVLGAELLAQGPHHAHRRGLLLRRVAPLRGLSRVVCCFHDSILVSKLRNLHSTQGVSG